MCLAIAASDDHLDSVLVAQDVAAALATLTPSHRDVLVEIYMKGKSIIEAAEILGIPIGTVKSRAYYALRALKLTLEERGVTL